MGRVLEATPWIQFCVLGSSERNTWSLVHGMSQAAGSSRQMLLGAVNPQKAGVGSHCDLFSPHLVPLLCTFPLLRSWQAGDGGDTQSATIPGLKAYVVCFGGFRVYVALCDPALQREKSFSATISLEVPPKGLHIQGSYELSWGDKEKTGT